MTTFTPRTWAKGDTVGAADLNAQVRDPLADHEARITTNEARFGLDITKIRPSFLASLQLARIASMQCVIKDPVSGNYFVSQNTSGTTASAETTTISRVSETGTLLDFMVLEDAGHGTTFGLEVTAGVTYIWIAWQAASPTGVTNDLVKFKYVPNSIAAPAKRADNIFTVMPRFGTAYTTVAFDWANDWVLYRTTTGSTAITETYTRRRISEVKAGVDKTYGKIVLPAGLTNGVQITMQGMATIDDSLYRYTGNANSTLDPALITRYDWATGAVTGVVNTDLLGTNPDGSNPDGWREPEGISLYRDPASGLPSLIATVTVRPNSLARQYLAYIFTPAGQDNFLGTQVRNLGEIAPVRKDGRGRRVDTTLVTSLAQVLTPGWTYLTGAEFGTMTDKPTDANAASGHWLEVSGYDTNSGVVQRLVRNSGSASETWLRITSPGVSTSPWVKTGAAADIVATQAALPTLMTNASRRMPSGTTSLHSLTTAGWYYLTGAEFGAMTDKPSNAVTTSGHYLQVSGTDSATAQVQRLTRNTIGGPPQEWFRVIDQTSATNATKWQQYTITEVV